MSYRQSLEAAGAVVHAMQDFGSYQGDWWAKLTYEGKTGWVHGYYGSCSGCDAFEAEFGYGDREKCEDHEYDSNSPADCELCKQKKAEYDKKLANFGREYLDNIMTQEEAEAKASENLEWDHDAEEMVKFIKENNNG